MPLQNYMVSRWNVIYCIPRGQTFYHEFTKGYSNQKGENFVLLQKLSSSITNDLIVGSDLQDEKFQVLSMPSSWLLYKLKY
ncbi:hypothetical protein BDA96_04G145400 [Sorghum bicolor]|uniref:Uncharacterized protein n=1 Tax=Sorghum bicolor TaxID=4558 RepID=A0A921UJ09_SORBI|nr:hypothetical protein BDA96_04G145400 [Sorghum bicolor]